MLGLAYKEGSQLESIKLEEMQQRKNDQSRGKLSPRSNLKSARTPRQMPELTSSMTKHGVHRKSTLISKGVLKDTLNTSTQKL